MTHVLRAQAARRPRLHIQQGAGGPSPACMVSLLKALFMVTSQGHPPVETETAQLCIIFLLYPKSRPSAKPAALLWLTTPHCLPRQPMPRDRARDCPKCCVHSCLWPTPKAARGGCVCLLPSAPLMSHRFRTKSEVPTLSQALVSSLLWSCTLHPRAETHRPS